MKKVELTGVNTSELLRLSNQEMIELFKKMAKGDEKARNTLINGNLRLVLSVLQRFRNSKHAMDDLFQVGCIGLTKAVDNFDINKGVKFSTYAVPMIIGEIKRHIRDNREIRVSRSLRKIAYQTLQLRDKLRQETGEEPTLEEISDRLNISREKIVYALEATKNPISLFKPVFEDEGDPIRLMDQIKDEQGIEWTEKINVQQALGVLTPRERLIICFRFYYGKTQSEIASKMGVSQAQISRIQKKSLKKLRGAVSVKEEIK